ncbi:hypothetical protein FF38_04251 [Lucilia cuprina]|uniref:Uncharacterized protein n=1 Tax=Lucilia cuprina TaxID=7375 RepID=A0A0L0BYY3_LUCCU|nr:hypothetical protein FF38_04251 [Lucilia cuprina]
MFRTAKQIKPLAQVLREKNSRNRFVSELTKNEEQLFNRSLDSAQTALLEKKPNLKQTKLYIRRSLKRPVDSHNDSFTTCQQMETKTELFIMPSPKMKALESKVKLNKTICGNVAVVGEKPSGSLRDLKESNKQNITETTTSTDLMSRPGRNMLALVGKVDFVLKINKLYPKINVLWDVYGKLLKISKGKNRYEHILLMRNSEGDGPILQCIYYDFDRSLESYKSDYLVHVVGHITGCNRLRIFKIQQMEKPLPTASLMRIQNVNSFVLLQNQTT